MSFKDRLMELWRALQQPSTTFSDLSELAGACNLNPGAVLRHHFETQRALALDSLEA